MTESAIKFIKKISASTLGFPISKLRELCAKKPTQLFDVYGVATGVSYGSGDNGDWTKFKGQFEVVNAQGGEISRSGELFLPNAVTPILEAQIIASKGVEGFKGIQFGIAVGVKKTDTPIGYEYTSKDLMPQTENDMLAQMRTKLLAKA